MITLLPPPSTVTRLSNDTCIYCGVKFGPDKPSTREHVIGRRFVPQGVLASNEWNLIAEACATCNALKADLEDEISAVTLQGDIGVPHQDPDRAALALRKAKGAKSRLTGKSVADSGESLTLTHSVAPGVTMKVGLVAPARMRPDRVRQLAWFHLQAFAYWSRYEQEKRTAFIPEIVWIADARKSDWGNVTFQAFAELTHTWQPIVFAVAAKGNFRLVIRRDKAGAELWSFALEWNTAHRVIGFFGDALVSQHYVIGFPRPVMTRLDNEWSLREEVPLGAKDQMFDV